MIFQYGRTSATATVDSPPPRSGRAASRHAPLADAGRLPGDAALGPPPPPARAQRAVPPGACMLLRYLLCAVGL